MDHVTHPNLQILATPTMYYLVGQTVQCVVAKTDDKQPLLSMIGKSVVARGNKLLCFH